MSKKMEATSKSPKKQVLIKFILLLVILAGYFGYLSYEYDIVTGGVAALLTWSFFVLCTPIADAGFLLDFPLRIIFGIRMVLSEIVVWCMAIAINITTLYFGANYYDTTALTKTFHEILITPFPYWGVIILSGLGTFLSIRFGDELMDVIHHRDRTYFHKHGYKHELIIMLSLAVLIAIGYYELISSLGINEVFEQ